VRSFGIAPRRRFITGALGDGVAVFKVGTRRTIFSFYMFIVVYLIGTGCSTSSATFIFNAGQRVGPARRAGGRG